MITKLAAFTLMLVAFGLSSCYTVPGDSDGTYAPPDRNYYHHRGGEQPPYYAPYAPAGQSIPNPPPSPPIARPRVPSYVPPPQPQPNLPAQPQPRVRVQSPTAPQPKAPPLRHNKRRRHRGPAPAMSLTIQQPKQFNIAQPNIIYG